MFCCKFAHFAGTDDHDGLAGEISENLSRQLDGGVADGNGGLGNSSFGPDLFRHRECPIHQCRKVHPHCTGVGGDPIRLLHLPKNLRLTDDHGIETGRHAENMANHIDITKAIEML